MSSKKAELDDIPLVDTLPGSPVYDLLAAVRDEDNDEVSRSIWSDFRAELIPRLEALSDGKFDGQQLKNELHAIRGTSSQFGLFLLEIFLFAWEKKETDSLGVKNKYLPGAIAIARLSLDAIEKDLPHLRSPDSTEATD
ncbi:MAG: hypothetical protein ACOYM3_06345 [Terrimicrobiaceae bacterium]